LPKPLCREGISLVFNSLKFAVFLPVVLLLFWLSPTRWRIPLLLIASYIFYMAWRPVYLFLILGLTVVNYWLGLRIWSSQQNKKAWLYVSVFINLATLAYFKYFYFLEDAFSLLLKPWFGEIGKIPVTIVLPLGISFFVFEFLHYVIDVYRGHEPVRDFGSFALFPAFFPTQIAGPIKRFQDFVPQLKVFKPFSRAEFDQGMFLILGGLFKKVLLADNLALFVNAGFSNTHLFTGADLWLFALAFDFQVYFDFSGYADIARGSAMLLGYKVPVNFNFPYLANSIADFWQRWHITLGSWLRDYVYTPLGWTRSRLTIARNLLITFTLCGLWHGAEFHYILWGMYQGALLALHREFRAYRRSKPSFAFMDTPYGNTLSIGITFILTTVGMAIFRAQNTQVALFVVRKMLFLDGFVEATKGFSSLVAVNYPLIFPSIFLVLPTLLVGQILINRVIKFIPINQSPRLLKAVYAAGIMFLLLAFAPDNSPRFIYYQF
jgi:D-alanyl-lipoteichoic acid acyltransferase DltB (MBOAT superfamily)